MSVDHVDNVRRRRHGECNNSKDDRVGLVGPTNGDAEHPTGITMSRDRLASDTYDLYFSYIKVNLLLYTCQLDPFLDGILLDPSRVHA